MMIALHKFLKTEALERFIAGIVVKHSETWKVNTNEPMSKICASLSGFKRLIIQ